MSANRPTNLEEAIRQSGQDWLIDWFAPPGAAMDHLRRTLDEVSRRAQERLGGNAPDLSESSLLREYARNPQRVRGFFQALGHTRGPDMLLMAWRIIQGMEIKDIRLTYHRQQAFEASVVLESPDGEEDAPYTSSNIQDFALLRHLGILEISGRPVFDGFYPYRVVDKRSGASP
jgi:hypothetical protein